MSHRLMIKSNIYFSHTIEVYLEHGKYFAEIYGSSVNSLTCRFDNMEQALDEAKMMIERVVPPPMSTY